MKETTPGSGSFMGRLGYARRTQEEQRRHCGGGDNSGLWEESIFHKTKLRTGLESNRVKELIAKLRITAGYKPVKRSLGPNISHFLICFLFYFLFPCRSSF